MEEQFRRQLFLLENQLDDTYRLLRSSQQKIEDIEQFMMYYQSKRVHILQGIDQKRIKLSNYYDIFENGIATRNYSAYMQNFLCGQKGAIINLESDKAEDEMRRKKAQLQNQFLDIECNIRSLNNQYETVQWDLRRYLSDK
ncbi:multidrug resistance efflux pump [Breznakia sp. PF5-3]|uniref:hypothetical protein n=1 Tax=unclassified Breznakia TaxID=2623764 RepID=UPI00240718C8|nr:MULTISPECIES: hypothetical protein [unclassified Breznakia]MDF9824293.1 multidrug resistance efflux pump [Breznakia sp. PM6-1]MDF9835517.1 multidrug resistance efflux pump [Breznakia sp. PF5-3]